MKIFILIQAKGTNLHKNTTVNLLKDVSVSEHFTEYTKYPQEP